MKGGGGKESKGVQGQQQSCWQGTAKALELALTHTEQQEVCEMEPDCFCSDKRSQHRHKCVFIESVQSVLRSSRHRKCCVHVLENTWDEYWAGKVPTSWEEQKWRGPVLTKFSPCCMCILNDMHEWCAYMWACSVPWYHWQDQLAPLPPSQSQEEGHWSLAGGVWGGRQERSEKQPLLLVGCQHQGCLCLFLTSVKDLTGKAVSFSIHSWNCPWLSCPLTELCPTAGTHGKRLLAAVWAHVGEASSWGTTIFPCLLSCKKSVVAWHNY